MRFRSGWSNFQPISSILDPKRTKSLFFEWFPTVSIFRFFNFLGTPVPKSWQHPKVFPGGPQARPGWSFNLVKGSQGERSRDLSPTEDFPGECPTDDRGSSSSGAHSFRILTGRVWQVSSVGHSPGKSSMGDRSRDLSPARKNPELGP